MCGACTRRPALVDRTDRTTEAVRVHVLGGALPQSHQPSRWHQHVVVDECHQSLGSGGREACVPRRVGVADVVAHVGDGRVARATDQRFHPLGCVIGRGGVNDDDLELIPTVIEREQAPRRQSTSSAERLCVGTTTDTAGESFTAARSATAETRAACLFRKSSRRRPPPESLIWMTRSGSVRQIPTRGHRNRWARWIRSGSAAPARYPETRTASITRRSTSPIRIRDRSAGDTQALLADPPRLVEPLRSDADHRGWAGVGETACATPPPSRPSGARRARTMTSAAARAHAVLRSSG